jgi:hypothetical protein
MHGATREAFDTIAAIGPQTEATSAHLSKRGGTVASWRRVQTQKLTWRNWAFPDWERVEQAIASPDDLHGADPSTDFLFLKGKDRVERGPQGLSLNALSTLSAFLLEALPTWKLKAQPMSADARALPPQTADQAGQRA